MGNNNARGKNVRTDLTLGIHNVHAKITDSVSFHFSICIVKIQAGFQRKKNRPSDRTNDCFATYSEL